ncbi:LytR/AlgR family response regulator transcription factor [Hanstruepera marina]|uniref:LytR/AlgR family response regulator transcription factor n=1 Tax=Hanstruepera marina TaxID=2873265 RepID=UPI001CA63699|nr:LytTR family transcriptional regulator DNA-binding domain-containing protein [Hanstruepera marina]
MTSYFIIDNNDEITNTIKKVFADYSMFNSIGFSSYYDEAMNKILKKKPDIIFFNLDDVFKNSFEFVSELNSFMDAQPNIIGISKDKNTAYLAIKHSFVDFLLNPLTELEVRKSILKLKKKHLMKHSRTLCLKSYKDFQYLNIENILFLKADNNTTEFYISDGSVVNAYKTLKTFETNLPNDFLRIHKSYIVNKNYVSRINYGKLKCTIDNTSHVIPFTKTYIDNIEFINNSLTDISVPSQN